MKRKLGLLLVASFLSASAMADGPKVKVELRGQLLKQTSNVETPANEDNNEDEDMRFNIDYIRVDLKGKVNDELSYRLKFRLNKAQGTKTDSMDSVDYAYFDHKVNDMFKIRVGKQYINQLGFEGVYSSKDLYGADSGALSGNTGLGDNNAVDFYRSGIGFFFDFGNNDLNVQFANNNKYYGEVNQSAFIMGFQWTGHFMDGALSPMVSYHQDSRTVQDPLGTAGVDYKGSSIVETSLGLQYKVSGFKIELDYLTLTDEKKDNSVTTDKDDKVQSTVLRVDYSAGKWTPIFKYILDTTEMDEEDYSTTSGFSIAVEYKPWEKANFKYFVATSSTTEDFEAAASKDVTIGQTQLGFVAKF